METTRTTTALALCILALASVTLATAPAAAQTAGNDDGASNATELDATFEREGVDGCPPDYGSNPLTLTANRAPYHLTVTADDLDADHLVTVFDDELDTADPAIENLTRTDGGVRMRVRDRNATIAANFSDAYVPSDDHEIRFETDGGATADEVVTVLEAECVDARFLRGGSFETGRSGVVVVPIQLDETDEARVRITGEDLLLSADIEDGDDDGIVELGVNTHLVGRNVPDDGNERTYWTREGLTVREHGRPFADDSPDSLTNLSVDDIPGGDDPLPIGEYTLEIRKYDGTFDTAQLSITDTAVADFESWIGPSDALGNATAGVLRRAIGNDTFVTDEPVASDSALVYEIESTSLFGPLEAAASQYDGSDRYTRAFLDLAADRELSAVPGNPIGFDVTADSGAGIDLRETHRSDGLVVVRDHFNRTLYVGLRPDRLAVTNGTAVGSGEEFEANLTVHEESSRQPVTFRAVNVTLDRPSTPGTPGTSTPDESGTERDRSTDTTMPTTSESTAPETTAPAADDTTDGSPDVTTTADGPGFGAVTLVTGLLVLCVLVVGRRRN